MGYNGNNVVVCGKKWGKVEKSVYGLFHPDESQDPSVSYIKLDSGLRQNDK